MKKLLLALFLITGIAQAQNQQTASLGISHQPSLIFDWENVNIEAAGYIGGNVFSIGANVRTNSDFKDVELSLISKTKLFTPNEKINGELLAGVGFGLDQINEDAFGEKHRNYFLLYGLQFNYQIAEDWRLYWSLKKQHGGFNAPPIGGIGATIRIN